MEDRRRVETTAEMQALGRELAAGLEAGAVVALNGELGAGKTELVKGLAAGLGFEGAVTSPSFTLLHEYCGGRLPLFHFDFYRIESLAEVLDLGWDELLEEGVVAVEWAERFPELLPEDAEVLRIEMLPTGGREVRRSRGEDGGAAGGS